MYQNQSKFVTSPKHLSPVTSTCQLSPESGDLTIPLCSFSGHESPRRFSHATSGGLVIDRVLKWSKICLFSSGSFSGNLRNNLFNKKSPSLKKKVTPMHYADKQTGLTSSTRSLHPLKKKGYTNALCRQTDGHSNLYTELA